MPGAVKTGRAVTPIMVRPRSSEQRAAIAAAADKAGVSLNHYALMSMLAAAELDGFHAPPVIAWVPRGVGPPPAPRARRAAPRRA